MIYWYAHMLNFLANYFYLLANKNRILCFIFHSFWFLKSFNISSSLLICRKTVKGKNICPNSPVSLFPVHWSQNSNSSIQFTFNFMPIIKIQFYFVTFNTLNAVIRRSLLSDSLSNCNLISILMLVLRNDLFCTKYVCFEDQSNFFSSPHHLAVYAFTVVTVHVLSHILCTQQNAIPKLTPAATILFSLLTGSYQRVTLKDNL